ncbi:ABC transporter substrate-binding protein [Elioraea rosea]|uniref:ABC transporter substrate-binding protein n=1 Tax=Elioraea rosea TaxID=2492390 RepID=UPI0011825E17|nr:ABC transporter substrate-binding protein [Elioraea rosea]
MMRTVLAAALALSFVPGAIAQTTLRIGLAADPNMLDPAQSGSVYERVVFSALCDKLIELDADLRFVPQLATEWAWGEDGKTLTLKLRQGVRFHDGTPMDAAAVKANLDRYREARESRRRTELASVASVEVVDPLTVRLALKAPDAPLLAVLADRAGMMMSPAAIASLAERIHTNPSCSGPFRFVRRVTQEVVELERFPEYWDAGRIHIDRVEYRPIPDGTVRLVNLRSGQLDLIERLSPNDVAAVERDRSLRLVAGPAMAFQTMSINVGAGDRAKGPLGSDPRVRAALEAAIDRQVINQVALEGQFIPSNQFEAPNTTFWVSDRPVPPRDVARARALLREAGHQKVAFELAVPNTPVDRQVAEVIQSMAAEAGFDISIRAGESAAVVAATRRGDYDAAIAIWSGRPDPDGNISIWLQCEGFVNWGRYCNPKLDELLARARGVTDTGQRRALYREAAGIWMADRPHLVLYHHKGLFAARAAVTGFAAHPDGLIRLQDVKVAR